MTVFEATRQDAGRLESFLTAHTETSMFLRGNLLRFGIGQSDHDYAMRYFIEESEGKIAGVGAISNGGTLMIQTPDGVDNIAEYLVGVIPAKNKLMGVIGDSGQVAALSDALGLGDLPVLMNDLEPLMSLNLNDLKIPDIGNVQLRTAQKSDLPLVTKWRLAYVIEAMSQVDSPQTRDQVKGQAESMIDTGQYRILEQDGTPISFTGFNATMPDCVQIGGVFTPPELRAKGFARTAVALHLEEARKNGASRAILFASGEPAVRAYSAIGFSKIGHFTLKIFDQGAQ